MAGDTRDSSANSASFPPSNSSLDPSPSPTTKAYATFPPPLSPSSLPEGAGRNTAGQHAAVPRLSEAVKTVRVQDFKQVYMYPCARDSLLLGIGGAFGVGGVRVILGAPIFTACSWAVGTFCFAGIGSYEFCQQKRRLEKVNMKRAVEIMDRKKAEKETQQKEIIEARRRTKEEAERKTAGKGNWKFW